MIPTAEEWVNQQFEKQRITSNGNDDVYCSRRGIIEACTIFAKLHVEAALKSASEKALVTETFGGMSISVVNKNSILNAYPLDNIK